MHIGALALREQPVRRPDGGRHRPAVPPAVPAPRRRAMRSARWSPRGPSCGDSLKTSRRANHDGESAPIAVQIAGTDAPMMAEAARYNIDRGAQIIDINMGCPAKKVCNEWAGSALMQRRAAGAGHRRGGGRRLRAARRAGDAEDAHRLVRQRAQRGAHRARREDAGVAMVAVHGRTREQGYKGLAEYDTVAAVKAALRIPVVANGDIDSPQQGARRCCAHTGCRRADDRPRRAGPAVDLPRDRALPAARHAGRRAGHARGAPAGCSSTCRTTTRCTAKLIGVRSARKHIGWAVRALPGGEAFRARDEHARRLRRAGARGGRLLRRAGRRPCTGCRACRAPAANDDHERS